MMGDIKKNGWWRRFGRGIRTVVRMTVAAGFGALAGYLFDPERGRARRTRLADQAQARLRDGMSQVKTTAEYQKGVAKGVVHKVTEPLRPVKEFDEETLIQKVRSEAVGVWRQNVASPATIEVESGPAQGQIVLSGTIGDEEDHRHLLALVSEISGVVSVDDRISVG